MLAHGLSVGKNFKSFSPYAFDANWPWLISVGDNVVFSQNVKVLAHDASTNLVGPYTKVGLVTIGDNVFVGANVTILCNVEIGNDVIIGAGSVVTCDIPANSIAAGNPARVIDSMENFRAKHQQAFVEHPYFNKHKWNKWIDAPQEDKDEMKEELKKLLDIYKKGKCTCSL